MVIIAEINEEGLEYCQLESFKAQCSKSEVVMMTMAKYGRMHVGISEEEASLGTDKKNIGCYRDELEPMHSKCSLERECQVSVPNKQLDSTNVCFSGLKLYLEALFSCFQGPQRRLIHTISFDQPFYRR